MGEKREGAFALTIRVRERLAGASAALLLQAGFLFLLFQATHLTTVGPKAVRELSLIIPRLITKATKPDVRTPATIQTIPDVIPSPPLDTQAPTAIAPPAALQGIGQSLFGCSPDRILSMTLEQRSHCPAAGERPQQSDDNVILNPKSHSKKAALWQEQLRERDWAPTECQGNMGSVIGCQVQAMHDERMREEKAYSDIEVENAKQNKTTTTVPNIPTRRGR